MMLILVTRSKFSTTTAWKQQLRRLPQTTCRRRGLAVSSVPARSTISPTQIGFCGLGNMGLPMVQNLAKGNNAANRILAYDVVPETRRRAQEAFQDSDNVTIVESLSDLVHPKHPPPTNGNNDNDSDDNGAHVVITMLPSDAAVDTVLGKLHQEWLASSMQLPSRRIVIDCSTVSPSTSQKWSKTFQESGTATLFDAPVSGGVKGATEGTLTFMLGGCSLLQDTIESNNNNNKNNTQLQTAIGDNDITPVLQQMGSHVMECGPHVGAGAAVKLCNNLALAAQMIGICEALNLGDALGVDPNVLTQVLNSSTAACWSSRVNNPHPKVARQQMGDSLPAANNYRGGFGTQLMLKDLGLALQVAHERHVALPLTSTSKELYQLAHAQRRGAQDFGVVLQVLKGNQVGPEEEEDVEEEEEE